MAREGQMHWKPQAGVQVPSSIQTGSAGCAERLQAEASRRGLTAVVAKHCDGCLNIHLDPIHTTLCRQQMRLKGHMRGMP
jgi:hypothetical protein